MCNVYNIAAIYFERRHFAQHLSLAITRILSHNFMYISNITFLYIYKSAPVVCETCDQSVRAYTKLYRILYVYIRVLFGFDCGDALLYIFGTNKVSQSVLCRMMFSI